MNQRKKKQAGIAKVRQRLADPKPLSDVDRKQISDFLQTVEDEMETVNVFIQEPSGFSMPIGPSVVRGLGFGCGFMIVSAIAMFVMGFLGIAMALPTR